MAHVSPVHDGPSDYTHKSGKPANRTRFTSDEAVKSPEMLKSESGGGLDPAEVRAALAQLLGSPTFRKSAQLSNFLRFVVEETLAGRGGRMKAYTIATAALGRDEAFDPQSDPIVRVEAARLRRALRAYYANGGADDGVVIELPTGSYAPVFRPLRQQRRSGAARLRDSVHELAACARENRRLLLLFFAIAVAVSVIVELLDTFVFDAF